MTIEFGKVPRSEPSLAGQNSGEGVPFGRYLLTRKIGYGGMAEVFLGRRIDEGGDSDLYVIKCILPKLAKNPQYLAMFVNEAQLAAQMQHPSIVKVFDFGEFEGRLFMAMEFVDGLDCWRFARRLYPWGKNHTSLAIWVICRVLEALDYAHQMCDVNGRVLNVVHRDLSPSNIYLSMEGDVKLGDFGIARIDSERYREVTMIPNGKFGYVAPEQVEGLPITRGADIFAAGVVLTELLIGEKMFTGKSQLSVMMDIKDAKLDTLEKNVDRIENSLLDILRRSLARNPDDRYADACEFRIDLENYLDGLGVPTETDDLGYQVCRAVNLNEKDSLTSVGEQTKTPKALELTPAGTSAVLPSPQETPTCPASQGMTPLAESEVSSSLSETPYRGTPITAASGPFEQDIFYQAKLADGRHIGPTSYAHIIELICSDQIGPETLVCADGRRFLPASNLPELTRHLPAHTPTWEFQGSKTPDRKGVFVVEAPGEVLLSIALRNESGMLVCRRSQNRKEVYFREGSPVYVSSNSSTELLGEFLVAGEMIERPELELALALLPKFNGHMGDTLVALGMISASELFGQITRQIKARFVELLSWRTGYYEFYRDVACRSDVLEVFLDPFSLVSETLVTVAGDLIGQTTLKKLESCTVIPSSQSQELLGRLKLPDGVSSVLLDTFSPTRVGEFSQCTGDDLERQNLALALFVALETGLWMIEGGSPPWRTTSS